MKRIEGYMPEGKYSSAEYELVSDGIYCFKGRYVTAMSFQQEPEYGEGSSAADISQYPLEDILDKYCVFISDFFKALNTDDSQICHLEFTGFSKKDVTALRSLIGKHVYCREVQKNNEMFAELVIE